ncbi:hypothetical protein GH714_003016 [Hevea brasiliensis]|uniref:Retroviral polymerase SH3-like domain-containing protein n=1 Tax=Hevea brasiliensis TaxID=3981 RepID=A0A6A6N267_HEVBR|nr:hypothetical protein GH714_003016 [Hevea brasiliensis]
MAVYFSFGYGQDEFGYRLYLPVEKKLVKSIDVVFFEDQTIKDIEKVESSTPQNNEKLSVLDPILLRSLLGVIENGAQDDTSSGQHHEPIAPSVNPSRRSTREGQPSTRYSSDQYVLLTDGEEPECFEEAVECMVTWIFGGMGRTDFLACVLVLLGLYYMGKEMDDSGLLSFSLLIGISDYVSKFDSD